MGSVKLDCQPHLASSANAQVICLGGFSHDVTWPLWAYCPSMITCPRSSHRRLLWHIHRLICPAGHVKICHVTLPKALCNHPSALSVGAHLVHGSHAWKCTAGLPTYQIRTSGSSCFLPGCSCIAASCMQPKLHAPELDCLYRYLKIYRRISSFQTGSLLPR